jgi:hypothetical protein
LLPKFPGRPGGPFGPTLWREDYSIFIVKKQTLLLARVDPEGQEFHVSLKNMERKKSKI